MPSSPAAAMPASDARPSAIIADALVVDRDGASPGVAAVRLFSSDFDRAVAVASASPARAAGAAAGRGGVAGLASSAPDGRPRAPAARRPSRGGRGGAARRPGARTPAVRRIVAAVASVVSASGAPARGRRSSKRPRSLPRPDVATDEPAVAGAGTTDARAGDAVEEPTGGAEDSGATAGDDAGAADVGARGRVDGQSVAVASASPTTRPPTSNEGQSSRSHAATVSR